jgi:hypothetical protein
LPPLQLAGQIVITRPLLAQLRAKALPTVSINADLVPHAVGPTDNGNDETQDGQGDETDQ